MARLDGWLLVSVDTGVPVTESVQKREQRVELRRKKPGGDPSRREKVPY